MKTHSLADACGGARRLEFVHSRPGFALAVVLGLLFGSLLPCSQAATVDTLGGGPKQSNPSSFGSADGDTFLESQFNLPAGVALDPGSRYLYVADTANNAVRKLDLSGNLTTTFLPSLNVPAALSSPVDVAVDGATNLYVLTQGDGFVRKYDSFGNFIGVLNGTALLNPTALALNASTNIVVALNDGSVVRINHPTNTTATTLAPLGTFSAPRGIEVMDDGTIVVSDTGNNAIRLINPSTLAVTQLTPSVALPAPAGSSSGTPALARFNGPHHITKAGNNVLIVADTGNHQVRQIDANGTVTLLYGVDSSLWTVEYYPGWSEGNAGPNVADAHARLPEGVVVDGSGSVYATEQYYHIIRSVIGTGLSGPTGTSGGTGGTNAVINPPSLTISPQSGYFPMGTTITVTSTSDKVYYTTDGTAPTTNSTPVTMVGGTGSISWFNSTNDLTALQVAAFLTSGTNTVSTNVAGAASTTNLVGVPGDMFAGIGATAYIPVVLNLRSNVQVRSISFSVEVAPVAPLATPVTSVNVISTSTNDFVGLTGVSSDGNPVSLTTIGVTNGTAKGVAIASLSPTNYLAKNFGVTAVVEVKIPAGLAIGDKYSVSLKYVTGTSDGGQTDVPLVAGPSRNIIITNISYLVGDTAPGRWYNAGDFGNTTQTNLDNADVNNIFLASVGIKVPYAASDAFNAMDTSPELQGSALMGDGLIMMNDWLTVLNRSLRLDVNNFYRGWNNGALTNSGPTALAGRMAKSVISPPGAVWFRHASITAPSIGDAVPGSYVTVPVYASAAAGVNMKGVQFRAAVTPVGSAPPLAERPQVEASSFAPARVVSGGPGVTTGEVVVAYYPADFLGSNNQLGSIRFRVPATAVAGDAYAVSFSYLSGTLGLGGAEPAIESVTARVVVLAPAPSAPAMLPDQWKTNFFGSLMHPDADPNADPDGDGVANWKEYQAGTDPTKANSRLKLENAGLPAGGSSPRFQLLTAPGKAYVLECTDDLSSAVWTTVATFTGDGYIKEFIQSNALDRSQFYRVRVLP